MCACYKLLKCEITCTTTHKVKKTKSRLPPDEEPELIWGPPEDESDVAKVPPPEEEVDMSSGAWYIHTAQAIGRAGSSLIKRLKIGQLIPFWNTWCEHPVTKARAVAYADCVLFYDTKKGTVWFSPTRSPMDNVYMGITRNLLDTVDPTLEAWWCRDQ